MSDPNNDLILQDSGTFTFTDASITYVNQALVQAADDTIIEACECFEATISDISPTGTTAADALGAISSAQICVLDDDGQDGESE